MDTLPGWAGRAGRASGPDGFEKINQKKSKKETQSKEPGSNLLPTTFVPFTSPTQLSHLTHVSSVATLAQSEVYLPTLLSRRSSVSAEHVAPRSTRNPERLRDALSGRS